MGIQLIRRSPSGKVSKKNQVALLPYIAMRLHLVLGVTLLMHSLEVKGGPTADIEGDEKTCKALYHECKDTSECCQENEGGKSVEEGEVICGSPWDDHPIKRCRIKPA